MIPFEQIQSVSLANAERLLADWFPRGRRVGKEFCVGNLAGDAGDSLKVNLTTGMGADFAAGGEGWHDLIDLRAAMLHCDRTAAARAMGDELGITSNGKDHLPTAKPKGDQWDPIVPPPTGAPKPQEKDLRCDMLHEYADANDRVLCYVRRFESKGSKGKLFLPLTYGMLNGKCGWHAKAPTGPLPLYGLNRLTSMPDATVILCEGEKAANAAQAQFPDHACLSWMGGAKRVTHADLTPLKGRNVIVWPDNDPEGHDTAQHVALALSASLLRVDDLPAKADAADVSVEDPGAWLASRLARPITSLGKTPDTCDGDAMWNATACYDGAIALVRALTPMQMNYQRNQTINAMAKVIDFPAPAPAPRRTADDDDPIEAAVREFNDKYMVVNEGGKAVIYQPCYDEVLERCRFDRLTVRDLQTLYLNKQVQVGVDPKGNPICKNVAAVWLRHPCRLQYIQGVKFDPTSKDEPGVLNLWKGFAIGPLAGDWSLMQAHIRDVICNGDPVRFDYLIRWLARMFQKAAEQGEVAVVMKGKRGTGKGTLAAAIRRIVGQHGLTITNHKHLVGNFNAHLRDCIFLFADEAFFAGDKAHIGVLNGLITDTVLTIEGKNQNIVTARNYLHIAMASNEDWVVPAAMDERRYFVLDVADTHRNDRPYFRAIAKQMESGGYQAMLHDLMTLDLTGFDVRDVPETDALQEQKKRSLPTTEAWWLDCLSRGYVWQSKLGLEDVFADWHPEVATELLFASYETFAKSHGERRPLTREALGGFFTSMNSPDCRLRGLLSGEHIIDVPNAFGGITRKAEPIQGRKHGYSLGALADARGRFCQHVGVKFAWDSCDDD